MKQTKKVLLHISKTNLEWKFDDSFSHIWLHSEKNAKRNKKPD